MFMQIFKPLDIVLIIAILVVIAAIIIPSFLPEEENLDFHATDVIILRTIFSAQEEYHNRYGTYGTVSRLEAECLICPEYAHAGTAEGKGKAGYYFDLSVSADGSSWSCTSRPQIWDVTANRNAFIDNKGTIYYNREENCSEFVKKLGE